MQKILVFLSIVCCACGAALAESDTEKIMKLLGCWRLSSGKGVFCGSPGVVSNAYACVGFYYDEGQRETIYSCSADEAACTVYGKYACCGGTSWKRGQFVEYEPGHFFIEKTKDLPAGGTCTQQLNPCGDVVKDCDEPDDCPLGQVLRTSGTTKVCVERCGENQGYESEDSLVCIGCSSDAGHNRGVDAGGICVKCSSDSFFKDTGNCLGRACCHAKSQATIYTKNQMAECWRCASNPTDFRSCLDGGNGARQKCGIKE